MAILWPVIIIGGLGLTLGVALALAARAFSIAGDSRVDEVRDLLPGANCGACGYPGCDGLAKAILQDGAPVNACTVASVDALERIARVVGVDMGAVVPLIAAVHCRGTLQNTGIKYLYEGLQDCAAVSDLDEGLKNCPFACLGMGNCVRICPTQAITIVDGLSTIDHSRCITCGKCVAACPRAIIQLLPDASVVRVQCSANLKGKAVRENCTKGCIACGLCAKACKFGAIRMHNDLPIIDYDKCVGCLQCADVCPRQCIWKDETARRVAFINAAKCTSCGDCYDTCAFGALDASAGVPAIDADACTGCGACDRACTVADAIRMIR